MSKKLNPSAIGAFVIGATLLLVLGLMIFAIVFWVGRYLINKQENPYFRG